MLRFTFWSNWGDLDPRTPLNWRTFKFIGLEVERDILASDRVIWEIFIGLLGLNLSISCPGGPIEDDDADSRRREYEGGAL